MKYGPDIARIASLIGDPARANILTTLMGGQALTAGELAREAGVTAQTASSHFGKLSEAGLIAGHAQGRHRYFALASDEVGEMLETMFGVAADVGHTRVRTGPREPEMRQARTCYDHLAGTLAVAMLDALIARGRIAEDHGSLTLTAEGGRFFAGFGLDMDALTRAKRPLCRSCLDWSVRRPHLGGGLGAALLSRVAALGWAKPEAHSRAVRFSPSGLRSFRSTFGIEVSASRHESRSASATDTATNDRN